MRHFADFSGRSRRLELIAFYVLVTLAGIFLSFATAAVAVDALPWVRIALGVAFACPFVALMVRRLHDTGRTGWWALLGAPEAAFSLWRDYALYKGLPLAEPDRFQPSALSIALGLLNLTLLVLLLWNDDPEANRYGPNPRYDPQPEETQPA